MEDCDVRHNLTSAHLTMLYDDGQQKCINRNAKVNLNLSHFCTLYLLPIALQSGQALTTNSLT